MVTGEKKLGKVITPDPWKAGARNTTGKFDLSSIKLSFLLVKELSKINVLDDMKSFLLWKRTPKCCNQNKEITIIMPMASF